jgi:hypothetical protein
LYCKETRTTGHLFFIIDWITLADLRFIIEDSRERREKVQEGTGPKRIHRSEFVPKVTEGHGT